MAGVRLGSAHVNIRANLKPLRKGLAMAKKVVTSAMRAIGSVLKKMYSLAKKAALAFVAMHTLATVAAIKQEAAEIELAQAMKFQGDYTKENFQAMKEYAAEIQSVTKYGDEAVLMLMRMAKTFGLSNKEAQDAAKAAIALYEGFGGGRGKPAIFLRYYIQTIRDAGSSLNTYIPTLMNAKTHTEKMVELNRALAAGWDAAKAKAQTAGGALVQIKNIIGDIAEIYGQYFLPAIKGMRDWFVKNQTAMKLWAGKTAIALLLVKDLFVDFIIFARNDWSTTWRWMTDVVLAEFRILNKSFKPLMKQIGNTIKDSLITIGKSLMPILSKLWEDVGGKMAVGLERGFKKWRDRRKFVKEEKENIINEMVAKGSLGGMSNVMITGYTPEKKEEVKRKALAAANKRIAQREKEGHYRRLAPDLASSRTWQDVIAESGNTLKEGFGKIKDELLDTAELLKQIRKQEYEGLEVPEGLMDLWKKSLEIARQRLEDLIKQLETTDAPVGAGAGAGGVGGAGGAVSGKIGRVGLIEAWQSMATGLSKGKDKLLSATQDVANAVRQADANNVAAINNNKGMTT